MYHDFESYTITRRSFLKGAGAVGAVGLLAACGGSSSSTAASASSASSGAAASGKGLSELFTYETSGARSRAGICSTASWPPTST